jgi:hypothetical protein
VIRHNVNLREESSGQFVDAVLIERIDAATAKQAEGSWQTYLAAARLQAAAMSQPGLATEHEHWRWAEKVKATEKMLPYPTLAIECGAEIQGLMLLETDGHFAKSPEQAGSPLVYVNLLATAPWNLPNVAGSPRYKGVGTILLSAAVTMSVDLGFKGRIGLHSLSRSETWYDRLGMKCLGPDLTKQSLKYYEMGPEQAARFIA